MLLGDAADSLQWAISHAGGAIWLIAIVGGMVRWAARKQKALLARQAARARQALQPPASAAAAPPPVPALQSVQAPPPPQPRAVFVRPGPARAVVAPGDPPPAAASSPVLRGAFGDAAHARTAVILAEVLAPPVALR
jgi:hypothetical protein